MDTGFEQINTDIQKLIVDGQEVIQVIKNEKS